MFLLQFFMNIFYDLSDSSFDWDGIWILGYCHSHHLRNSSCNLESSLHRCFGRIGLVNIEGGGGGVGHTAVAYVYSRRGRTNPLEIFRKISLLMKSNVFFWQWPWLYIGYICAETTIEGLETQPLRPELFPQSYACLLDAASRMLIRHVVCWTKYPTEPYLVKIQ